ncbi:hypothetical protein [Pseudohaliea rubra]|uniref:Uncharacterized protein n=1 Tax=Pseudohaliea rubra DSM 19751 TaxID=1265313 RepID=A0A095VPK5_9GAMM|nr:hypothetical protein [Pseudohaliea rubra]KGE03315.1 hypothetical protein HRUBRA_02117 [Pseudohaliea rubra DSM 19751]
MQPIKIAVLAGALTAAPAFAECTAPGAPSLPEGASASMEEMLAGQKAVKTFQEANIDYMKCVEGRITAAKEASETAETKDARAAARETYATAVEAYNEAVSTEETVAGNFNTAVREYQAANK